MDYPPYHKEPLTLTFHPESPSRTITVTIPDKTIYLDATEANDLLEWLYQKRDLFFQLEMQQGAQGEKR